MTLHAMPYYHLKKSSSDEKCAEYCHNSKFKSFKILLISLCLPSVEIAFVKKLQQLKIKSF